MKDCFLIKKIKKKKKTRSACSYFILFLGGTKDYKVLMDQFHHVSTAFLELGKGLVLFFMSFVHHSFIHIKKLAVRTYFFHHISNVFRTLGYVISYPFLFRFCTFFVCVHVSYVLLLFWGWDISNLAK